MNIDPREAFSANELEAWHDSLDDDREASHRDYDYEVELPENDDDLLEIGIFDDDLDREESDGQPDSYTEWQDYMGGDDWDHGQYESPYGDE